MKFATFKFRGIKTLDRISLFKNFSLKGNFDLLPFKILLPNTAFLKVTTTCFIIWARGDWEQPYLSDED